MKSTNPIIFAVAVSILLAGSAVSDLEQKGELAGVRGLPVEGHDTAAAIAIKSNGARADTCSALCAMNRTIRPAAPQPG